MRILIVEDEFIIAERIERFVQMILDAEPESLAVASSVEEAKVYLQSKSIELLFLDLNLNGADGFELLEQFVGEDFHTVIISAYEDKAIKAFEYGVLDFIGKPFERSRLEKTFQRYFSVDGELRQAKTRYLSFKHGGRVRKINLKDISFIAGAGGYSEVFLSNNKKMLHAKSLDKLLTLLPSHFERVHKSYIVDMNAVHELIIQSGGSYHLRLKSGQKVPVGRSRYASIREKWFSDRM